MNWSELSLSCAITNLSLFIVSSRPYESINQKQSVIFATLDHFYVLVSKILKFSRLHNSVEVTKSFKIKTKLTLVCITATQYAHFVCNEKCVSASSTDISYIIKLNSGWSINMKCCTCFLLMTKSSIKRLTPRVGGAISSKSYSMCISSANFRNVAYSFN